MSALAALVARWPNLVTLAGDLGVSQKHLRVMISRGRIPRAYWPALEIAARRRRIAGVTRKSLPELQRRARAA